MKWEKVRLEDCCYSISDGDHQPPPKAQQGIPFVTISNINSMNQLDFSDTMFVPKEYYRSLDEKRKVRKGDVLYSVVGSFGIPVLIKEERPFVFQRHIAILRPKEVWGDRIFEKCGIRRDEGGDGGKTLEIRGKRRLSARDGGANYQQS